VGRALDRHCPGGIDVDYENVAGPILDQILIRMNLHGRVSLCGLISTYDQLAERVPGPYDFAQILMKRLRVEGFIVTDYAPRFGEALAKLGAWAAAGKLRQRTYEIDGFDRLPDALRELVGGKSGNIGKTMVRLEGA
jgi:NADPH-dependent curcumin reductase